MLCASVGSGPVPDVGPALSVSLPDVMSSSSPNTISVTAGAGPDSVFSGELTETGTGTMEFRLFGRFRVKAVDLWRSGHAPVDGLVDGLKKPKPPTSPPTGA